MASSGLEKSSRDDETKASFKSNTCVEVEVVDHGSVERQATEEPTSTSTTTTYDPVFGKTGEGAVEFRRTKWPFASFLMMKTQVGIGALSIPGALSKLGLIPGCMVIITIALLTTWSNAQIRRFVQKYPDVSNLAEAGKKMFGSIGYWSFFVCLFLYYVFTAASALVSVSTCFNALSGGTVCTAIWIAVAAIIAFILASCEKLEKISWLSPLAVVFILASLFTVSIAVAFERPAAAPQTGPWTSNYKLFTSSTFPEAMSAVASIVFAYTGTPYFFNILTEMKEQGDYKKAMYLCQSVVTSIYLIVGIMVYVFCGSYVTSPALGSAGPLLKKIAYGEALPGLLVTSMIVNHIPAKTLFLTLLTSPSTGQKSHHITAKTWQHTTIWSACVFTIVLIAYLIASAVPNFSSLVSLIGALFGSIIVLAPYGMMALHLLRKIPEAERNGIWRREWLWAGVVICVGCFVTVTGTWGALRNLVAEYRVSQGQVWSCRDNSGSLVGAG